MRGTRVKQLRRAGAVEGPGPDVSPGVGRSWRRLQVREGRDDVRRARCVEYLTGLEPGDRHLLGDGFDWVRECGSRRLLAHVHRVVADRSGRVWL